MNLKKIVHVGITVQFLAFSLLSTVPAIYAAEMPNAQDIKDSIVQQATGQTNTIHADTSSTDQQPAAQSNVTNTGDNANTNTSSNNDSTTEVNNQNTTDVKQTINAEANTGRNQANGNISINGTGAGIIQTGDATVNASGTVNAGSNSTAIYDGSGSGGAGSNVVNTGNDVSTTTTDNNTRTTLVNNGNTTIVNQSANVKANTGDNEASGNISIGGGPSGAIVTGNASTNTSFLVTGGGNVTLIGGSGNGNGPGDGASIILANTGNHSRFTTTANNTHYTVVNNNNRAVISQMCGRPISEREVLVDTAGCISNTGGNTSNGNINRNGDAGVIETGDAVVNVTLVADANHNTTGIQNGNGAGNTASSDVLNTGNGVDVNTATNSNSATVVNNNNEAYVDQSVNAIANTGDNTANSNISFGGCAGCIKTGNATVNVNLVTNVNSNDTVVAGPLAGNSAQTQSDSTVVNTGDDVTVNTAANNNDTTVVNNTNELSLLQRVWSVVTSGLNRAAGNIGSGLTGFIMTGSATSTVNEEVNANTNATIVDPAVAFPTTAPLVAPAVSGPAPTNPPAGGPTSTGNTTQSNNSGGSSTGNSTSTSASTGSVLGIATSLLPATGPELTLMIVVASILILLAGSKLRTYKNKQNTL